MELDWMYLIEIAQVNDRYRVLLNAVMNIPGP